MDAAYTFFDHTGDFGADLAASSLPGVYDAMARALVALVTDAPESVEAREERSITLEAVDAADLLVTLGNELLFLFETAGWLTARVAVHTLDDTTLGATLHGEPFDPERHPIARPIKAVTHHGAALERTEEGWRARVIFDL